MNTQIVGRDRVIQNVIGSRAKMTIITGDSGVGKTTVLAHSQQGLSETAVAPVPERVGASPGALQLAILEQLATAVVIVSSERGLVERVALAIDDAVDAAARKGLRSLASAIGRHLIGLVRSQLGDAAGDALSEAAQRLSVSVDERVAARIVSAADGDVLRLCCSLAEQVSQLAGGRLLSLALDDIDRLPDEDTRRLVDLATYLPETVVLRCALTTADRNARERVDYLVSEGAREIRVQPLRVTDVEALLHNQGLDTSISDVVFHVTGGHALFVVDAIALLVDAGGNPEFLESVEPPSVLLRRTRISWRALSPEAKRIGALLVRLPRPIRSDTICSELMVDSSSWRVIEAELVDSAVFSEGERPWFHELRRRAIWQDVLTDGQREEAQLFTLDLIRSSVNDLPSPLPDWLETFADSAANAPDGALPSAAVEALQASVEEVAVAGAIMELTEPRHGQPVVVAEVALQYARETFHTTGDLSSALDQLVQRELVLRRSNDRAAVIGPIWQDPDTPLVLAGRAVKELGRTPVPSVASTIFESIVRPMSGAFRRATYGVGRPAVGSLGTELKHVHEHRPDGSWHIGRGGASLILRAQYGPVPLYTGIAYESIEDRDHAANRLEGLREQLHGRTFELRDVLRHPMERVRSRRFSRAVARAYGQPIRWQGRSSFSQDLPESLTLEEEAQRLVEFREALRDLCSPLELLAYELDLPVGMVIAGYADHRFRADLIGTPRIVRVRHIPDFNNPTLRADLAVDAGLAAHETIGRVQVSWGGSMSDPVLDVTGDIVKAADSYNESQERVSVELEVELLEEALNEAANVALDDARFLQQSLSHLNQSPDPVARTRFVFLVMDEPDPSWVPLARASTLDFSVPNGSNTDEVTVATVESLPSATSPDELAEATFETFGVTLQESPDSWTHAVALDRLAELLSYNARDVHFNYPVAL